ncbi:unnamed protein product [Bursaphelenchus okinawaensis]|uniref:DNA replication complex GINS protein SLD5 n=1 Tax=Bursaphelenchus okinawaensis TaxID=465554 RepID=A0A811L4K4_9BILA|nr:unnamed protein product [Bursaphelenchus okinawaensis]CAG9116599.1 unnamed protein product [Bursaphelenchus okinawaensis]
MSAEVYDFDAYIEQQDEEADGCTIAEVVRCMKVVWQNERVAPLILPHRFEYVDVLQAQIVKRDQEIEEGRKNGVEDEFRGAKKYEVARVRYMVNSYLRTRLQKIERNPAAVMARHLECHNKGKPDLLDAHEVTYAENIVRSNLNFFNESFLSLLPPGFNVPVVTKDRSEMKRCFVKVSQSVNVTIGKMTDPNLDTMVALPAGTLHYVPFYSIQDYIDDGSVTLM